MTFPIYARDEKGHRPFIPPILRITSIVSINLIKSEITNGNDSAQLTSRELGMFILLINSCYPLTSSYLVDQIWKGSRNKSKIWTTAHRLRKKLAKIGLNNIVASGPKGYIFNYSAIKQA